MLYKKDHPEGESLDSEDAFGVAMREKLSTETAQLNEGLAVMGHSFEKPGIFQFQFGPYANGGDVEGWVKDWSSVITKRSKARTAATDDVVDWAQNIVQGQMHLNSVKMVLLGSTKGALFMAKEGFTPITNGYATFALGRAYDQIRVSVAHPRSNVKYFPTEGLLGGDGPFHEGLESVALGYYLPHMQVQWPCDNVEANKATLAAIRDVDGPIITLQERAPKPVVTNADTPYQYGIANIISFTGRQPNFADSFETCLSTDWSGTQADIAIVAIGSQVAEAMRAAVILKETNNLEATVVNLHTLKPLDRQGVLKAVQGCRGILTVAQQQKTVLGNIVAGVILEGGLKNAPNLDKLVMMGIDDGYGGTGKHNELIQHFGLTAEHIALAALELLGGNSK